jgi:hypothetical protein
MRILSRTSNARNINRYIDPPEFPYCFLNRAVDGFFVTDIELDGLDLDSRVKSFDFGGCGEE